ncbi:MAG: general secretion pathway protein GspB [Methylococcus sp.]|nr:general secretion pathway protein GspB [Methylococcus sp.]
MSYILDALRKSERERKLAQAASLDSMVFSPEPVHKRPWLPWILSAIAVVNVAVLGYFLGLNSGIPPTTQTAANQTPPPPPQSEPAKAQAAAAPPPTIAPAPAAVQPPPAAPVQPPAKPVITQPLPPARLAEREDPDSEAVDAAEEEETGEENTADETMEAEDNSGTAVRTPRPPVPAAPKQNAVPLLSDMPPAFQSRVPQLKINLFAYGANPDERFVVINMNRQSIGATVADGVRLERIDEDSLTLSFEGQRFRIERP